MNERPEQFGQYLLEERLAVGGMAEIFKAKVGGLSGFERVVAVKRLHAHLGTDEDLVQMLIDEARLAVRLMHANIGQVFDLGCINNQYFIVMEYISGSDLHRISRRLLEKGRLIPTPIVLYVVSEMLAGLDYAHNCCDDHGQPLQLVHRDISPQNIMFSMTGDIKLVDFGIAKARMQAMQTQAGIIKGKFYYMSPEQAHGQTLDRRTDVFASGMVLYELLAGRPAYDDLGDLDLIRRVRKADFPPLSHFARDIDPELERIIMKALHRNPRQRFQSARRLQSALVHYMRQKYKPVTKFEAAEFLQSVLSLGEMTPRPPSNEDSLRREDYNFGEASLILDASRMPGLQIGDFAEASFGNSMEENPFADSNEATHVYMQGDNNPFAIPDEITAPGAPRGWGGLMRSAEADITGDFAEEATIAGAYSSLAPKQAAMPELGPREATVQTRADGSPVTGGQAFTGAASAKKRLPENPIEFLLEPENRPKLLGVVAFCLVLLVGLVLLISSRTGDRASSGLETTANASELPPRSATSASAPQKVFLLVSSNPDDAQVFVDGELFGTTSMTLTQFSVGERHTIKIASSGYDEWEEEIEIVADMEPLDIELEKIEARGVLKVVGISPQTTIEFDGNSYGRGPQEINEIDTTSPHKIVATAPDGTRKVKTISWSEGDPTSKLVSFEFENLEANDALPEPPKGSLRKTSARKKTYRKKRKSRRKSSNINLNSSSSNKSTDPSDLSVWGTKKTPEKKAPEKKKEEKKEEKKGFDVW